MSVVKVDNHECLQIIADFSKGGQYVAAQKKLDISRVIKNVVIKYKTEDIKKITVRMVDVTGQVHQKPYEIIPDNNWNEIVILSFKDIKAQFCWGGAGDKKWHAPCSSISILLDKTGVQSSDKTGKILIESIVADLSSEKIISDFKFIQHNLGNIFEKGESPKITIETKCNQLQYYIKDFNDKIIETGYLTTDNHIVQFQPKVKDTGFYSLYVSRAADAGLDNTVYQTDFAILPRPDKSADRKNHFGVCTHFAQGWSTDVIPLIKKAGIDDVRDELYWGRVEKVKGVYSFQQYQSYMDELKKYGVSSLIALTFANKLYDDGLTPYTESGNIAYSKYADAVLIHFPQIKKVDVWNEYNGTWCEGPAKKNRPKYYTAMLKQTYLTVKKKHPDVQVFGSAAVLMPLPYFEGIFTNGGLNYMDDIVIHPYRSSAEGTEKNIEDLKALAKEFAPDKRVGMVATEYGCFEMADQDVQASYFVRMSAVLLSTGIKEMYWYLMKDYSQFVGMGLLHKEEDKRGKYTPSPAYVAMAVMNKILKNAEFEARVKFPDYSSIYALKFRDNASDLYILWSPNKTQVSISVENNFNVFDIMGHKTECKPDNGKVVLTLNEYPIYIPTKISSFYEIQGESIVLTDSLNDYSEQQGDNNWFYGYYPEPGDFESFAELAQESNMWGVRWAGIGQYLSVSSGGMHPGLKGKKPLWAVRRWRSDITGEVNLNGYFKRSIKGDGSSGVILVNGIKVFDKYIGGKNYKPEETFNLVMDVKPETIIDFCVTPGKENILLYDGVQFRVRICGWIKTIHSQIH
jgi:hypothetical protein